MRIIRKILGILCALWFVMLIVGLSLITVGAVLMNEAFERRTAWRMRRARK